MSAKDILHQSTCITIEKDGWNITYDPLYLKVNDVEFYIDLGAERLIAAEKAGQKNRQKNEVFLGDIRRHGISSRIRTNPQL